MAKSHGAGRSQNNLSRTDPSQKGLSRTDPSEMGLSGTDPSEMGMSVPDSSETGRSHDFSPFIFPELVVFSVKHGCERQCTVSRERRQRRLTWRQPPAQHLNACRVLREPAGTRGMQPESTRSHHATYDTATCPERACGFANTNLHVGRTCQGIPL